MLRFFRTIRKKLIEEDNIRKYLLYAIGEILLVVIGILIALQVNNWNEERIEQRVAMDIRSSILQDLNRDIESIDSLRINIQNEIEIFDSFQLKLIEPNVSEDEVLRLIKEEFLAFIYTVDGFNDSSYRTALSSGTINVLSESERVILNQLYTSQSELLRTSQIYEQLYLEAISDFNASYPLQLPFTTFKSGPVYDRKWKDPDFDDLTSKFNNAGTSKRNYYRIIVRALNEIIELKWDTIARLEGNM